jgi:transcriptional regulator with XRE-family HTH domain
MVAAARNLVPEFVYPGTSATTLSPGASSILAPMATPEIVERPESGLSLPERNGTDLRRRELGAFLRSRRERIKPEEVGLLSLRRRRTPGLRREEVAQLAGVGVTWYTWLEQGRDIRPSAEVLHAIARTLQLDTHEHSHLFTLAGVATTTTSIAHECLQLCPTVQPLIDQLEPFPAMVLNARLDVLAYNRTWASFHPELDAVPIEDRNILWLAFTHPDFRKTIVDWEDVVGRLVAEFRAAMAGHLDEAAWKELVARVQRASPEFSALWDRHEVHGIESRTKRARHPSAGLLQLEYTSLWLDTNRETRIVAFTPADERSRVRLEQLHESLTGAGL